MDAVGSSAALPFTIVQIDGRGLGVVAARDLKAGERLLREAPLVVAEMEGSSISHALLEGAVDPLSPEKRTRLFELSQNAEYGEIKNAAGIAQTNGIPFRWREKKFGAVYYTASRFNHSCAANTSYKWAAERSIDSGQVNGFLTVHATTRITAGTELTFNYLGFAAPREQRRERLLESFGFTCTCAKCALSGAALRESEERLAALGDPASLSEELNALGALGTLVNEEAADVLAWLERRWALLVRESPPDGVLAGTTEVLVQAFVEFCDHASSRLAGLASRGRANEASGNADGRRLRVSLEELEARAHTYRHAAREWASRARDVARLVAGDDSPSYVVYEAALARCWPRGAHSSVPEDAPEDALPAVQLRELWIEAGAATEW